MSTVLERMILRSRGALSSLEPLIPARSVPVSADWPPAEPATGEPEGLMAPGLPGADSTPAAALPSTRSTSPDKSSITLQGCGRRPND